jgi:hypothetical protein
MMGLKEECPGQGLGRRWVGWWAVLRTLGFVLSLKSFEQES